MKNEEYDWILYHYISGCEVIQKSDLVAKTGWNESQVNESLARLSSYLLIEQKGEEIRPLSIQEMIFSCQCKYDPDLPLIVKDGVISVKKNGLP